MIDPNEEAVFPNNVVKCLGIVLPGITEGITLLKRPLRPADPDHSIGVYGTLWTPEEDSYEMGHAAPNESTLSKYQVGIQTLVKHGEADKCLTISSILTRHVRAVLYRNQPLRVALGSLYVQDTTYGYRESMRRWGVRTQRYMTNDLQGAFVTTSVLDLWIETEMS